jgi:hypothetical protein
VFEIKKYPKTVTELLYNNLNIFQNPSSTKKPLDQIDENPTFSKPFDSLSFSERMKIKKDKAKQMLEKKREKRQEEETFTVTESVFKDDFSLKGESNIQ